MDFNNPNFYMNPIDTSFGNYNYDGIAQDIKDELTNRNGRGLKNGFCFYHVLYGNGYTIKNIWI